MSPFERSVATRYRTMNVFIDGECASDYKHVTIDPMTYVSMGHSGECCEIINALVTNQGGYVNDELGPPSINDEWVRLEIAEVAYMDNKCVEELIVDTGLPVTKLKLSHLESIGMANSLT